MTNIIYKCNACGNEYNPDELPDLEQFGEEGEWEFPCPNCGKPLVWGI